MPTLEMIFERAGALNEYWNLYIAVSLGALGIMASGKKFTARREVKWLITVAFVAFATANLEAIYSINQQRAALISLVVEPLLAVAQHARPAADWMLVGFHAVIDAIVVLCIWRVPWSALRDKEDADG